jgi:hypothetical protein
MRCRLAQVEAVEFENVGRVQLAREQQNLSILQIKLHL